jgi:hypothetical protein
MPVKHRSTDKKRKSGKRKTFRKTQRRKLNRLRQLTSRAMDYNAFVNESPRQGAISQFLSPRALSMFSGVNKSTNKTLKKYNDKNRFEQDIINKSKNLFQPPPRRLRRSHAMRLDEPDARMGSPESYKDTYRGKYRGPTNLSPIGRKSKKRKKRRRKTKRRK